MVKHLAVTPGHRISEGQVIMSWQMPNLYLVKNPWSDGVNYGLVMVKFWFRSILGSLVRWGKLWSSNIPWSRDALCLALLWLCHQGVHAKTAAAFSHHHHHN